MTTICYAKANNTEISIFHLSFAFLVKLHDTHHIIVAVLRWQVERNLSFVWLAVDGRTRFQQHLHGLRLPLPGCVVQRPHTCTPTDPQSVNTGRVHRTLGCSISSCLCVSLPFWSLMSTAACDSSSREMSSRFPLRAAWCSGENLWRTHTHTGHW